MYYKVYQNKMDTIFSVKNERQKKINMYENKYDQTFYYFNLKNIK